jgi:hypothetical protein
MGAMRATDSYMTALLQSDELIVPYFQGHYKVPDPTRASPARSIERERERARLRG